LPFCPESLLGGFTPEQIRFTAPKERVETCRLYKQDAKKKKTWADVLSAAIQ